MLAAHPDLPVEDLGPRILIPGLVDAHCHLEWSLLDGVLPSDDFAPWLGRMLAARRRMGAADHAAAARLGALRALRAGTTTLADLGPTGAGVAALSEAGLRGTVHLECFGRDAGPAATAAAAALAARLDDLDATAGARVRVGVSPHAPYTVGPELWAALAERRDTGARPWATHVAESAAEEQAIAGGVGPLAELMAAAGLAPGRWDAHDGAGVVERLAARGALRDGLVAAHCVRLRAGDAALLAGHGVAAAHCPRSNAHLRCGRAPLEALLDAGVAVGLGTDSPASGGDYDLRGEARACRAAHAGVHRLGGSDLLRLMTLGAANALGLADRVGALRPGMRADLVAVRPVRAARAPEELVLDERARVELVVVDGEVLLRDGIPLRVDAAAIEADAVAARARIAGSSA